jgi:endonuclease YncB( thermonuclease family)
MVVGVYDGDSITVLDGHNMEHKIRMMGIDAPEKGQPFANDSKKSLSDLVYGKPVVVDFNKRDRYRRVIGKVILNREDVNLEQVKQGMAWHYKQYQNEQELDDQTDMCSV